MTKDDTSERMSLCAWKCTLSHAIKMTSVVVSEPSNEYEASNYGRLGEVDIRCEQRIECRINVQRPTAEARLTAGEKNFDV